MARARVNEMPTPVRHEHLLSSIAALRCKQKAAPSSHNLLDRARWIVHLLVLGVGDKVGVRVVHFPAIAALSRDQSRRKGGLRRPRLQSSVGGRPQK